MLGKWCKTMIIMWAVSGHNEMIRVGTLPLDPQKEISDLICSSFASLSFFSPRLQIYFCLITSLLVKVA